MINQKKENHPIGVFDSGLGGLTVLKYLLRAFPHQDFIYLGDLANLPYGNKSKDKIIHYSIQCAKFLESKKVQGIIIACNTASSYALQEIKQKVSVPIFDVISPCVKKIANSKSKNIAILGTEKTIESRIYCQSINAINSKIKIYNKACPLFVPIIEEGLENSSISMDIIDYYLQNIREKKIEKIILGCTHYPILLESLNHYFNNNVEILHSGPIMAESLSFLFQPKSLSISNKRIVLYYVTDLPARFKKYGNKFLDETIQTAQLIEIENF